MQWPQFGTGRAQFVGLEPIPDWIEACSEVVFAQPRRSRDAYDWPKKLTEDVLTRCAEFPVFREFSFD